MSATAVNEIETPTFTVSRTAEPTKVSRGPAAPSASSTSGRFWYAFGRWLAVSPRVEDDFVLA